MVAPAEAVFLDAKLEAELVEHASDDRVDGLLDGVASHGHLQDDVGPADGLAHGGRVGESALGLSVTAHWNSDFDNAE